MPTLGQFSAWISVDNSPLPEYHCEKSVYEDGTPVACCWIPSKVGKEFTVYWKDARLSYTLEGEVVVDGVICDTWVEKFKGKIKRDIVMTSSAVYTSETTMRPYVFAKVEHTDDDRYLDQSKKTTLGEIKLILYRGFPTSETPVLPASSLDATGKVHERAQKGLDHRVGLGHERESGKTQKFIATTQGPRVATFVFWYRPLDFLQAMGIAARGSPIQEDPRAGKSDVFLKKERERAGAIMADGRLENARRVRHVKVKVDPESNHAHVLVENNPNASTSPSPTPLPPPPLSTPRASASTSESTELANLPSEDLASAGSHSSLKRPRPEPASPMIAKSEPISRPYWSRSPSPEFKFIDNPSRGSHLTGHNESEVSTRERGNGSRRLQVLQGEALEGESAGVRASEDGEVNVMKTGNDRNEEEDSEGVKDDDDEEEARQAHVTAAKIAELKEQLRLLEDVQTEKRRKRRRLNSEAHLGTVQARVDTQAEPTSSGNQKEDSGKGKGKGKEKEMHSISRATTTPVREPAAFEPAQTTQIPSPTPPRSVLASASSEPHISNQVVRRHIRLCPQHCRVDREHPHYEFVRRVLENIADPEVIKASEWYCDVHCVGEACRGKWHKTGYGDAPS